MKCRFDRSKIGATVTGFVDLPTGDEGKLKEAVALNGPVSVAIDAATPEFMMYRQGMYILYRYITIIVKQS